MKIHTTLQIGSFHTNNCEDFLINEPIASNERLIAVLDGCTMGTESVFASILFGKILRKIAKEHYYQEFAINEKLTLPIKLKAVIKTLLLSTKNIKNMLGLEVNELLSTLIIGIVDTQNKNAEFLVVGDGLIYVDGVTTHYDQDDKPDYLGYHLSKNFDTWYASLQQKRSVKNFKNIAICTDGIYTFKSVHTNSTQLSENKIIQFLLEDEKHKESETFFERKILHLKEELNHIVTDDLAIIRMIS